MPAERDLAGLRRLLHPLMDLTTGEVTDSDVIPACPHCAGDVFLNVRETADLVEAPYVEQWEWFKEWIGAGGDAPLLVLEFGAGFNTPGVIRWPLENVVYHHERARFVRVNPEHPGVPDEIADRSLSLAVGAWETVKALQRTLTQGVE